MTDEIWKRDEIDSPCVKICVIDPTEKLCIGCLRTVEEITDWSRLSKEARHDIMATLPARAPRLRKRRRRRPPAESS
ncbi:DUF1289 domain-containing protein [Aestuariibius insulae]|uniref:DUF1289 domain-containing protein n=1 Tax=Aestuariibius insulae TaxID=2058287 RepID=UPI00345EF85F